MISLYPNINVHEYDFKALASELEAMLVDTANTSHTIYDMEHNKPLEVHCDHINGKIELRVEVDENLSTMLYDAAENRQLDLVETINFVTNQLHEIGS